MVTAMSRKSITDLSRRRSRTFLSVVTLALAIGSIGLFALPALMNRAMQAAVRADRLPDLTLYTRPLTLDGAELASLAALPNVRAVEPRSFFGGRVYVGYRRGFVQVRGVPDLGGQRVDVVHVVSGARPRAGEVLTEVQNANQGLLRVRTGDSVRIIGADGAGRRLRVSGEGHNLDGGQSVTGDDAIVLYANTRTVASLSGVHGFDSLAFRLADARPAAVGATVAAVRRQLAAVPGFTGFSELPAVRAPGDWPGKSDFEQFSKGFYVITVLALLSALVLISNTITTLVGEQTSEIAIMEAIGGRRRQIAGVYLKTALLLGAIGTVGGDRARDRARERADRRLRLCLRGRRRLRRRRARPAPERARRPARAAPGGAARDPACGAPAATRGAAGDRLRRRRPGRGRPPPAAGPLAAADGPDRPGQRRAAQAAQPLNRAGDRVRRRHPARRARPRRRHQRHEPRLMGRPRRGRQDLLARTPAARRASGGPDPRHPRRGEHRAHLRHRRQARRQGRIVWALRQATMFHYRTSAGRWYTPAQERTRARVAVVERDIARAVGIRLGDRVTVQTASGRVDLRVIGISANQQENGTALYVPLTTMHALLPGVPADANDYWVRTTPTTTR
jgi:putative ABC transport system permease protein